MYIARILYPVKVLGPGNRIGIWFVGCHHRCKGCSNPELWKVDEKYFITIDQVEKLIRTVAAENEIDGFTITGGDPVEQADELTNLLKVSSNLLLSSIHLLCCVFCSISIFDNTNDITNITADNKVKRALSFK